MLLQLVEKWRLCCAINEYIQYIAQDWVSLLQNTEEPKAKAT